MEPIKIPLHNGNHSRGHIYPQTNISGKQGSIPFYSQDESFLVYGLSTSGKP